MTGIERLRELADEYAEMGKHRTSLDVMPGGMATLFTSIADQIERERAEDCFRMGERAAEDAEAVAWVREHGGLKLVTSTWENDCVLAERVIDELWNGDRPVECGNDDVMDELRRRLMPEGYEWPRYEGGPLLRYGDSYIGNDGDNHRAWQIRFDSNADVHVSRGEDGDGFDRTTWDHFNKGERVKRPAPKVLDADGVEIRVGDTVYGFSGQQYEVTGLCEYEPSIVHAKTVGDGVADDELLALSGQLNSAQLEASKLTHRAPVLAADGRPLREGETVYRTDSPTAFVVDDIMTREDGATVVHLKDGAWHLPQDLTHERPDSWKQLEEDVRKTSCVYFSPELDGCDGCPARQMGESCITAKERDLVRRARALAGDA